MLGGAERPHIGVIGEKVGIAGATFATGGADVVHLDTGMASHFEAARGAYLLRDFKPGAPRHGTVFIQGTSTTANLVAVLPKLDEAGVNVRIVAATNAVWYILVYGTSAIVLLASNDPRLAGPILCWFVGYLVLLRTFVPRLRDRSRETSEVRSALTGRVVDSYTNIPTVKLFAHADREDTYAREGMDWMLKSVNDSMRMSTMMTTALQVLSGVLIFTMSAMSIWLWYQGSITTGAIAFAVGLTLRLKAMSQWIIWEVAGLFENVGGAVMDAVLAGEPDRVREGERRAHGALAGRQAGHQVVLDECEAEGSDHHAADHGPHHAPVLHQPQVAKG